MSFTIIPKSFIFKKKKKIRNTRSVVHVSNRHLVAFLNVHIKKRICEKKKNTVNINLLPSTL